MAVITPENVTELVQTYYDLRYVPDTLKEKCRKMCERVEGKLPMSDIYNVFWAIRVLVEKYDHDDIEFHVLRNPIFAEISTDDAVAQPMQVQPMQVQPVQVQSMQVGLLRQAIRDFDQPKMIHYTKARLLEMNQDPTIGLNWIKNIENIAENEPAKLYPTKNIIPGVGVIYLALPAKVFMTKEKKKSYNIWI